MKEFSFSIAKYLQAGLRKDFREASNQDSLVECKGLKALEPFGLCAIDEILASIDLELDWPFPQIFRTEVVTVIAGRDTVYLYDETSGVLTQKNIYDATSPSSQKTPTAAGPWHFAGMGANWIMTNGVSTVFSTSENAMYGNLDTIKVFDTIPFQSVCAHKGRILYGGLSNHFWSQGMQDLINNLIGLGPYTGLATILSSSDNWVWFSSNGGGNVLWPIYLQLLVQGVVGVGGYGIDSPAFIEGMERNDFGWLVTHMQGKVLALKPLGDYIIAFGEKGIEALKPLTLPYSSPAMNPIATQIVSRSGIFSRDCVGGNDERILYIDTAGYLNQITPDLNVKRLGFREYMAPMLDSPVQFSYDPVEGDTYIASATAGYLLSASNALSAPNEWPTTVLRLDSDLLGFKVPSSLNDWSFRTSTFNMGIRQVKHITNVHLDGEGYSAAKVRVWWRASQDRDFQATQWFTFNPMGYAFPRIGATDFQVEIKGEGTTSTRIDFVNISYQKSDQRALRGIGTGPTGDET